MKYAHLPPDKKVGCYLWNHQAHLGSGAFGKVYLGKIENTEKMVAVKVMENKDLSDPYLQEALKNEIKILSALKGPNVVGLIEHLQTKSRNYIIQEFCNGGDLRNYLTKKGKIPEQEARQIFNDMLSGMKELVKRELIHRDLKPENTLINDGVFKVADYGFAKHVDNFSKAMLTTSCGTPLYMAPQILKNENYTTKSDVWSFGIIFFEILYGKTPWNCRTQYELIQKSTTEPLRFPNNIPVSDISKDFIKKCLQPNEKNRMSWDEVFKHPLYQDKNTIGKVDHFENIHLDKKSQDLIKELQMIIQKNNINLEELFSKYDTSKSYSLDMKEFTNFILKIDTNLKANEVESIYSKFDFNNDGKISFSEFKKLILETDFDETQDDNMMLVEYRAKKIMKNLRDVVYDNHLDIEKIFKNFDASGDASLNLNEFTKILQIIDEKITKDEAVFIFKFFDADKSNSVTIREFHKAMDEIMIKESEASGTGGLKVSNEIPANVRNLLENLQVTIRRQELDLEMVFAHFDKDKSGTLDKTEYQKLVLTLCKANPVDIDASFKWFDQAGDGTISLKEFQKPIL